MDGACGELRGQKEKSDNTLRQVQRHRGHRVTPPCRYKQENRAAGSLFLSSLLTSTAQFVNKITVKIISDSDRLSSFAAMRLRVSGTTAVQTSCAVVEGTPPPLARVPSR